MSLSSTPVLLDMYQYGIEKLVRQPWSPRDIPPNLPYICVITRAPRLARCFPSGRHRSRALCDFAPTLCTLMSFEICILGASGESRELSILFAFEVRDAGTIAGIRQGKTNTRIGKGRMSQQQRVPQSRLQNVRREPSARSAEENALICIEFICSKEVNFFCRTSLWMNQIRKISFKKLQQKTSSSLLQSTKKPYLRVNRTPTTPPYQNQSLKTPRQNVF